MQPSLINLFNIVSRHICVVACIALSPAVCLGADSPQRRVELKTKIEPLLKKHCLDCHSGTEADAGLALDHFDTPLSILKGRAVWEKAIQKLQIDEMPPPEASELAQTDRNFLIQWLSETIDDYDCGLPPNPGRVTVRRLNASEYQNTINDLLGVNYTPAAHFPGDDIGYGFDNIGDVLTLPPILMEKYVLAAERITQHAIKTPPAAQRWETSRTGGMLEVESDAQNRGDKDLTLASSSIATMKEQIPWAGTYHLVVTASGDQAGPEACQMGIAVDGKFLKRISVPNSRSEPREFEIELRLRAGKREVAIGFLNDYYKKAANGNEMEDRNLVIHHVGLTGRKSSSKRLDPRSLTDLHQRIISTTPQREKDAREATRKVLSPLASRAFRRPIAPSDLERLVDLAMNVQSDGGSFEESIQIALQAILISPKFLFRVEPPSAATSFDDFRDLDDFELATRLSYFLWSTMPDDELLGLAWRGELRKGDTLARQVKRMILHRKANAFVENFASQWLTLRKLEDFNPDPTMFPQWNDSLKALAERETLTFFAGVMRYDMNVLRLLDADFTYLNEDLATFYGIDGVEGSQFREVSLKGSPRAGLLTQISILSVTSNPTRTSPVKRGKWILDNLLASPPPPAPAGVPELGEKAELTGTLRQQMEQHRANPACASCHKLMDPLGFAMEQFDAIGRYRTDENGVAVDASGVLPDGTLVDGASQLRKTLVEKNGQKFVECLTQKMLTYALGRGLEYYDKCAVDKIILQL